MSDELQKAADNLAAQFVAKGHPCHIEAGPKGLIVYASTRVSAEWIAQLIARTVKQRDPRANWTVPVRAADEPEETAWFSAVEFDPRRL